MTAYDSQNSTGVVRQGGQQIAYNLQLQSTRLNQNSNNPTSMTSYNNNHYLQKQIVSGKKHTLHSSSQISILPQNSGKTPSGHSNMQTFAQATKPQNDAGIS